MAMLPAAPTVALPVAMVISPVLRAWDIESIEGLSGEAEKAREEIMAFMTELDVQATRFVEQREARRARQAAKV